MFKLGVEYSGIELFTDYQLVLELTVDFPTGGPGRVEDANGDEVSTATSVSGSGYYTSTAIRWGHLEGGFFLRNNHLNYGEMTIPEKRSEQRNFPQFHQLRNCPFIPFLMPKVLVDHLYHHHLELLQQESHGQFDFFPVDFRTQDSRIENHLPESLAIIGRVDPSEAQYQSAKELALIQTLSAGFEEVDLKRAQKYSVQVANNNGANAVSVAEHVLLQILSLFRQLFSSPECEPWALGKPEDEES